MGLLTRRNRRWRVSKYKENQIVYSQGDPAEFGLLRHTGKVKVTVISKLGKEAIVAIRGPDEFCGEGALNGRRCVWLQPPQCRHARLYGWRRRPWRLLHENQEFADYFLTHLLTRTSPSRSGLGRPVVQFQ